MEDMDKGTGTGGGPEDTRKKRTLAILTAVIAAFIIITMSGRVWDAVGPGHRTDGGSTSVSAAPAPSSTPEHGHGGDDRAMKSASNLEKARAYDWSRLKGQRVSNAYKMTSADGVDVTMLTTTLLTDDGKQMINPANWTITDISFANDTLTINLHHETGGKYANERMMGRLF